MSFPSLILQTMNPDTMLLKHIPFVNKESNPDLIWINREEPELPIEKIRELQQHLLTRPYQEDRKIIILLNIEQANIPAQNALLKSLEEPPDFVQFILTSKHPELLLETVRSRCQIIKDKFADNHNQQWQIEQLTITEKILLAEKIAKEKKPLETLYAILEEQKQRMETNPNQSFIHNIRHIHQAIQMLQANTNTRLCLEWCFFQMN